MAGTAVALLVALGNWQVRRLHWREADLAAKHALIDLPPVGIEEALAAPDAHRFRRARATGVYDRAASIVVLRAPWSRRAGARVLTPLRREGGGPAVLVDRGRIPQPGAGDFAGSERGEGPVEVAGLLHRLALGGEATLGSAANRQPTWALFNPSRPEQVRILQAQIPYPLAPLMIQRGDDGSEGRLLGGFERPRSPVSHLGYAITWYAAAALAAGTWIGLGVQRGREASARAGVLRRPI